MILAPFADRLRLKSKRFERIKPEETTIKAEKIAFHVENWVQIYTFGRA
jgi:hypothetical protein